MNEVRVGVIGCGYWGPNLIRNFVEIPESEVICVADLEEKRLSRIKLRFPKIKTTQDYHDLFSMGLDVIVIATPPETHFKFAKESMENNLHVLVEKPLTLKSSDSEELIRLANERNVVFMVGHTFEYNSAVRKLKEIIKNGDLGRVRYIDGARLNLGLYQQKLNVIWDLAPHDISIFNFILDSYPISVSAEGISCIIEGVFDVAYLNLIYPNNILAHMHLSWIDPSKVRRTTVVGDEKMVVYNDISNAEKLKIYDKSVKSPAFSDSLSEFQLSYHYGDVLIPHINFKEPLKVECQHFVDCILNDTQPISGGLEGLKVIRVLEAAQRSIENGGTHEILDNKLFVDAK